MKYKIITLMLVAFVLVTLIFPCVSAWDWDNVKSYDTGEQEVTIENALGLGEEIAKIKLITPLEYHVIDQGEGIKQKVAELEFKINDGDYTDALKDMDFYDLDKTFFKGFEREFIYLYREKIGSTIESKTTTICEDTGKTYANGSIKIECEESIEYGDEIKDYGEWKYFDSISDLPQGKVRVGIFVDVLPEETIEWIPEWFGVRIDEWAVWTESLNTGLVGYWKLDEAAGNVTDSYDSLNGTVNGNVVRNIQGKINTGANTTANGEIYLPNAWSQNESYAFWVELTNGTQEAMFIRRNGAPNPEFEFVTISSGAIYLRTYQIGGVTFTACQTNDNAMDQQKWYHLAITMKGLEDNETKIYIDGVLNQTCTDMIDRQDAGENTTLSMLPSEIRGVVDEIGAWSKVLSATEVSDLYNTGTGITYESPPSVSMVTPIENDITNINETDLNITLTTGTGMSICWWSITDGVTNTSTTGCENVTIPLGDFGDFVVDVWINDTGNRVAKDSANITAINFTTIDSHTQEVLEGEAVTFVQGINSTSSTADIEGRVWYNNTLFSTEVAESPTDNYTLGITAPDVVSGYSQVNYFNWSFNASFYGNVEVFNTTTKSQLVHKMVIGDCGGSLQLTALNFTHRNETLDFGLVNATHESTFTVWTLGNRSNNRTYSFNRNDPLYDQEYCILPNNVSTLRTDAYIKYDATGYDQRSYRLLEAPITNVTQEITLYMIDSTDSTIIFVKVQDGGHNGLPDYIVKALRYYPSSNSYKTIDMGKTDDFGLAPIYLIENDVDYKFLVQNSSGSTAKETNPMRIICLADPCTLDITLVDSTDVWGDFDQPTGVASNITYNNNTKIATFTWNDITGASPTMRFNVRKLSGESVCNATTSSTSGTMACDLSNFTEASFIAQGWRATSPETLLQTIYISIMEAYRTFGTEGILWSAILLMVLVFVGIWNPVVAIIMMVVGFIALYMLQLVAISYGVLVLIIGLAIIAIIRMRT